MSDKSALTPLIERRTRADGSPYFLGSLEELPGVLVCEDTFDAALQALRKEAKNIGPQVGYPNPRVALRPAA